MLPICSLTLKEVVVALAESDHQYINIIAVETQTQQKLVAETISGTFKRLLCPEITR